MGTDVDLNQASEILRQLSSNSPLPAWDTFLERYSLVILQVIHLFETGEDEVGDCFLFVCEELSRNSFHRLRRFQAGGPAKFVTWLRVVVRRLGIDWRRREVGRSRPFESIARLSELDRAVFEAVYQNGLGTDQAWERLLPRYPGLTSKEVNESCDRVQQCLTSRQRWLLATRARRLDYLDDIIAEDEDSCYSQISDPSPDPEALAVETQQRQALARAIAGLTGAERVIVKLRFEHELTLEQIARLTGLPDPQTADRRLRKILEQLRKAIGKRRTASV